MAETDKQPVDRIETAMHGTPKLHPDEQRKYLGTFRERVEVAVTVAQIKQANYVDALHQAFTSHPDDQLYINGNLDQELIGPYIKPISNSLSKRMTSTILLMMITRLSSLLQAPLTKILLMLRSVIPRRLHQQHPRPRKHLGC